MIKLSEQAWSIKDLLNGLKITPKIATQSQEVLSAFLHFDCLQDKLIFMTWAEFMFCDANVVETVRTITTGRKNASQSYKQCLLVTSNFKVLWGQSM